MTLLLMILAEPVGAFSENSWTVKASLHEAMGRLGAAVVNGKIYAIGGGYSSVGGIVTAYMYDGEAKNTNEEYNPETDTWAFKTPMPTPRYHFGIAVYKNKIYCIGGRGESGLSQNESTDANEVYDPVSDTWESKTKMPYAGEYQTANVVDGKIYVISQVNDCRNQCYDPETDRWTIKASPPRLLWGLASAVFDNKIYFADYMNALVQIYDPVTDSWSESETLVPNIGVIPSACVTSGVNAPRRIYFLGQDGTYIYDPASDSWSNGTSMITPLDCVGVANLNDTLYAIGGVHIVGGGDIWTSSVTRSYMPVGYGTVSPPTSTPTFSPSPSPTLSPSPTATPTASPTASLTASPSSSISQEPTQIPQPPAEPPTLIYAAAVATAVIPSS